MAISEPTAVFSIRDDKDQEIKQVMQLVYGALEEKGYNPVNQLVGYILSEDPTYITTYKNARSLIRRIDRDDLLQAIAHVPRRAGLGHDLLRHLTQPLRDLGTACNLVAHIASDTVHFLCQGVQHPTEI